MPLNSKTEAAGVFNESSYLKKAFETKNREVIVMPSPERSENHTVLFSNQNDSKAKSKTLRTTEGDIQKKTLDRKLLSAALSVLGVVSVPFSFFLLSYLPPDARNFLFWGVVIFLVLTFLTSHFVQRAYEGHNKVKPQK